MADEANPGLSTAADLTDAALRSAVDAAPDGILVVDETGTIVFVNPMTERLFEYERDELVGESVDRLLPDSARATHAAHRDAYMRNPRTRAMGSGLDLRGRQSSGSEFPVEISLSPVRSGERTLVIAIVRDVSARRATDAELTRARSALALGDERERIARDLHDTVIQRLFAVGLSLQATLTRSDPVPERINRAIDDIDDTIRDLRSTIFGLHARRAGGAGVRDDVLVIAHDAARVLGFEPSVSFDGPIDSAVTEPIQDHLISTLREALSNVARHAHASKVSVSVTIQRNDLVLSVSDDGIGIGELPDRGNGLGNMRERAKELGGGLTVGSPERGGTTLEWRVQLNNAADGR